jgi:hypothetical protein
MVAMALFSTFNIRPPMAGGRQDQAFAFAARQPSWAARLALVAVVAAALAMAMLVVVPVLVVGAALLLIGGAYFGVRRWLARQRGPNGALDGRRNVRVIVSSGDARP